MIRYVSMDGVIITGERRFAFYDTVTERFVDIAGDQSWNSIADLEKSIDFAMRLLPHKFDRSRYVDLARGNGALEQDPPE